jgi:hypothetical protein
MAINHYESQLSKLHRRSPTQPQPRTRRSAQRPAQDGSPHAFTRERAVPACLAVYLLGMRIPVSNFGWARIDAGEASCVRAHATAWRGDLWDRSLLREPKDRLIHGGAPGDRVNCRPKGCPHATTNSRGFRGQPPRAARPRTPWRHRPASTICMAGRALASALLGVHNATHAAGCVCPANRHDSARGVRLARSARRASAISLHGRS